MVPYSLLETCLERLHQQKSENLQCEYKIVEYINKQVQTARAASTEEERKKKKKSIFVLNLNSFPIEMKIMYVGKEPRSKLILKAASKKKKRMSKAFF